MKKKIKEAISLQIAKNPGRVVLAVILVMNILFFVAAAGVIYSLSPPTLKDTGFGAAVFYTITMVLDAGCISFIIEDVGQTSVAVIIFCLIVVILGMVIFTGAVIGYLTNYISAFIEHANEGEKRLYLTNHTVILNWNSRASEIVNDLLYSENAEKVVVLVNDNRDKVEKEITDRILDTLAREKREKKEARSELKGMKRFVQWIRDRRPQRLTVIVREGETFSSKQLDDISLYSAKAVIILGRDIANSVCRFNQQERIDKYENGNAETIKTLVQVAEITGAQDSADNQRIIVEVEDDWTLGLVNKIIEHKENAGKCNIIPVAVNRILGQILSQFSIMPELNLVYSILFSNKGAAFYSMKQPIPADVNRYMEQYLSTHKKAIPLAFMDGKDGEQCFYMAGSQEALTEENEVRAGKELQVDLNEDYWIEKKNVIILGHNSKSHFIMEGFNAFCSEWNYKDGREIMDIIVIDDAENLKKQDYYRKYSQVSQVIEADIYEKEKITDAINRFVASKEEDTSILVLSDDRVAADELDANALIYLIYVQDIIRTRMKEDASFEKGSIDVIVEIINPKNYDVVRSYSVDNVVISNRYVSKMMTQIAEKEALFDFYNDILTYDEDCENGYESKEIYAKNVSSFFKRIPRISTAAELIRAVYAATPEDNKAIVIGYVTSGGKIVLFDSNQEKTYVQLGSQDKLLVFSNH
ncbi:MAG: hypothetical protein Q4C58_13075 [Eubacteriales bacterium]|nr:hypothetical protein [Eubacteriales bacterium]